MTDYVLTTTALRKEYAHRTVLHNVSIHIPKGAIYGLVGQNGSGKTSLISIICGLLSPTAGSYTLFGRPYTDKNIQTCRKRMGAMIEQPAVYPFMTAEENLKLQYRALGLPSFHGISELLNLVGLEEVRGKKAARFSQGMLQRLGIALALAGRPDFVVLDDPINGLDPDGIIGMRELLLKLNQERQTTLLIASHILDELSRLATHYGFLDNGRILQEISALELENACRKCICLTVADTGRLCTILEEKSLEYRILSDSQAEIYSRIDYTELMRELDTGNCPVFSIHEREEGLENYYLKLKNESIHLIGRT